MTDEWIFSRLFKEALKSGDPRGVVSAALVRDDEIIAIQGSGDDGVRHAEDLLLQKHVQIGGKITEDDTLYVTLIPCIERSISGLRSCVDFILELGIQNVVYAADDPSQSERTKKILTRRGVNLRQVKNKKIIENARALFNASLRKEKSDYPLPNKI